MTKIDLVVFDMAGTTVKDQREVERCFAQAARQTGLRVSEEQILAAQGWSKRFVFEKFWGEQLAMKNQYWERKVAHSYQIFQEILEAHYHQNEIHPTKGALETFDFLRKHRIKICLTTGFYRKVADIILQKLGWLHGLNNSYIGNGHSIINMSITSDEVSSGRPAADMIHKAMQQFNITDPKRVIKIGDTPSDIQSARNADCLYALAVGNGTHSPEQLEVHQPDTILNDLCGFIDFLKERELV